MKTTFLILGILVSVLSVKGQKKIDDFTLIGDSTNIFKSIDEILKMKELQNHVVYADVWGTRCPPCLSEFKYVSELKKEFENDSVVFLYLCSPYTMEWDTDNEKLWKELIVKNNLEGINMLMSAECYEEGFFERYKDKYSEERLYGIPTYLLIDKQGNIVNFNAPRPSSKEVLYKEIHALLDK